MSESEKDLEMKPSQRYLKFSDISPIPCGLLT